MDPLELCTSIEMVFCFDTGEVKIETNNGTSWFNSGGFAEITEDKVELLLESIEKSNEIDVKERQRHWREQRLEEKYG